MKIRRDGWTLLTWAIAIVGVSCTAHAQVDGALVGGSYIAIYSGNGDMAARAAERAGGRVTFNHPGAGIMFVESASPDIAAALTANAGFSAVLPDRWIVARAPTATSIAEPLAVTAAAVRSPFGASLLSKQWNIFRTETDRAWSLTQGSSNVKVAIVDSGICAHHQDLAGKVDEQLSTSFVPAAEEAGLTTCTDCPAWEDLNGHGTEVASLVSTNNIGMAGVAPNVRLVAVKVADARGAARITRLMAGVLYAADAGSAVINVSQGFGAHPIREFPQGFAALLRMQDYVTRHGALLVFGAGNDGLDLDRSGSAVAVPCEATNGLCIGATTIGDALATYSNHGVSAVTMVAPGGGAPTSPFPDVALNRDVIVACSVHSTAGDCAPSTYFLGLGTSFAAPMVSGAAALVISRFPRLLGKPQQVKAALVNAADDLGARGTDNLFGKGRLNTYRAVQ